MKSIMFYVNVIAISVALVFSIEFYLQINIFFAVFCITLEATKPIFARRIMDKEIGPVLKVLIIAIICISTILSLLGCISNSSNLIQEDLKKQYKVILNQEWQNNNKNIKLAEENLNYSKSELEKYPNLETYLSSLKTWENKSNKITSWENNKKLLQDQIILKENSLTSLRNKTIIKYIKIKTKSSGYSEMLTLLSKSLNVKQSNVILILTIFMSLGLEIIILTSSLICQKDTIVKNIVSKVDKVDIIKTDKVIGQDKTLKTDAFQKSGQDSKIIENTRVEIEKLKENINMNGQGHGQGHVYDKFDFGQDIGHDIDKNIEKISKYFISEIGNYFGREVPSRDVLMEHFNVSKNKLIKIMKYINDNNLVAKEGRKLVLGNVINFDKYKKENTNG